MSKERKETHGRATERIRPGGSGGSHTRRASAHFRTFPRTRETARKRLAARLAAMRVTVRRGGFAEGFSGCEVRCPECGYRPGAVPSGSRLFMQASCERKDIHAMLDSAALEA